jgi:AraC family transcriptional regulator
VITLFTNLHIRPIYHEYLKKDHFQSDAMYYGSWMMFALEEGKIRFEINGIDDTATSGNLIICPPGTRFSRSAIEPLRFHQILFNWRQRTDGEDREFHPPASELSSYKLSVLEHDRFASTLEHLRKLNASRIPEDEYLIYHYVNDLWMTVRMEMSRKLPFKQPGRDLLMKKAKQFMDERMYGKVNLGELAASLHLSTSQLSRRFQAAYGINPTAYLTNSRLEKVKSLLEETEYTLGHISELCGYDNRCYLSLSSVR